MPGHLFAFEGLDQSGKQTQAELLRDHLKAHGRKARLVSFPDYGTSIGEEIARALSNERSGSFLWLVLAACSVRQRMYCFVLG